MHKLTKAEKTFIDKIKEKLKKPRSENERLADYVKNYDPDIYHKPNEIVRYLCSKANMTLNEFEWFLNLPPNSLSTSSYIRNHRVDAYLSYFFDVPISYFRLEKDVRIAEIAIEMRKLIDELERL